MHFDSGKLNKRISFLVYGEGENEIGQTVHEDIIHKTVWASVEPLRGYEQTVAERKSSETVYRVLTRYHKDITSDMTIQYGSKKLDITQIINVEERNFCLEIMAVYRGDEVGKE